MKQSIKNNNIDVVKLLIEDKRIDISKIREEMIKIAENLAYIDILKLLKNDDNSELTEYYTKKFKEIAKLFPERIHFIKAFTIAIKSCTQIMVDLLIGCIQHKYTNKECTPWWEGLRVGSGCCRKLWSMNAHCVSSKNVSCSSTRIDSLPWVVP